jgi:hypothetical protein
MKPRSLESPAMRMRQKMGKAYLPIRALALLLLVVALGASCASSSASSKQEAEGGADAAAGEPVAVYPLAGTPDASRKSEISFRGIAPRKLTGVRVVGSKSGRHDGRLKPHSDGQGASFIPRKPFQWGEKVTVGANVPLVGASKGVVSFQIARPPVSPLHPPRTFLEDSHPRTRGAVSYRSRPDLHPPAVRVTTSSSGTSPGYLFMAPKSWPGQSGPLIFDEHGQIVWFHPVPRGFKTYDFRTATYLGKPVLTWWQGQNPKTGGVGIGMIANSSYHVIATVRGGNGYPVDIHEFRVTPQGTALIIATSAVDWDLRAVGGQRDQTVFDGIVMEIDIRTGHVLFEWHALGHIPLTDSYAPCRAGRSFDFVHLNTVALDDDGNLLVSARDTSTVYKIDRRTGRIIWRLGGKHSSFELPKYARFVGQHDFTRADDGTYTLFDNANLSTPVKWASRGLVFSIDEKAHAATLLRAFRQPQRRGTTTQGSMELLPDGNYVVGWGGGIPEVSEFSPGGDLLYDARLAATVQSYRSYLFPWTGRPKGPPDVAVVRKKGKTTVYVSWNGATDVSTWQVLGGTSQKDLSVIASAPRGGFETAIRLPRSTPYVAVSALSESGEVLGRSKTIRVR